MDDQTAIEAFARVDRLRRELREAEAHLKQEVAAFSTRYGYGCNLREYQVRSQLETMSRGVAA